MKIVGAPLERRKGKLGTQFGARPGFQNGKTDPYISICKYYPC